MRFGDVNAAPPAARGVVLDSYKDEALDTAGDLRELAAAATHGRGRGRACGRARLSDFQATSSLMITLYITFQPNFLAEIIWARIVALVRIKGGDTR